MQITLCLSQNILAPHDGIASSQLVKCVKTWIRGPTELRTPNGRLPDVQMGSALLWVLLGPQNVRIWWMRWALGDPIKNSWVGKSKELISGQNWWNYKWNINLFSQTLTCLQQDIYTVQTFCKQKTGSQDLWPMIMTWYRNRIFTLKALMQQLSSVNISGRLLFFSRHKQHPGSLHPVDWHEAQFNSNPVLQKCYTEIVLLG